MTIHYQSEIFQKPESVIDFHWFCGSSNKHSHNYFELIVIVDGNFTHEYKGKTDNLSTGDAVLIAPNNNHFLKSEQQNSHLLNFSISKDAFKKLVSFCNEKHYDIFKKTSGTIVHLSKEHLDSLTRKINKTHSETINEATDLDFFYLSVLHEILGIMIISLDSRTMSDTPHTDWLINFLKQVGHPEVFCQPMSEIYKLSYYSTPHFISLFKKNMGKTPIQYVTQLRLCYAKNLLTKTNFPIIYISNMLNYSSLSHFIRIFTKETGYTPSIYRKKFYIYVPDRKKPGNKND